MAIFRVLMRLLSVVFQPLLCAKFNGMHDGLLSVNIQVLVLIAVYFYSAIMQNLVMGVSFVALSTSILLIGTHHIVLAPKQTRFNKIVCWFGKNSYELYLFHIIVLALMKEIYVPEDLSGYSVLLWMALFFAASSFLAGNIAKYYSQPMNKKIREFLLALRDRPVTFLREF